MFEPVPITSWPDPPPAALTRYQIHLGLYLATAPRPQLHFSLYWQGPAGMNPLDVVNCYEAQAGASLGTNWWFVMGVTYGEPVPLTHLLYAPAAELNL